MKKQPLLNTYVNNLDFEEVVQAVEQLIESGKPSYLAEINVDVILKMEKDAYLKNIMEHADLTLVDGQPLVWIAKWQKKPVKAKVSGSDLAPAVCRLAREKHYSVFILGGQNGAAAQAAWNLEKRFPGIRIAGTYEPPYGFEKDQAELAHINQMILNVRPDILLACLGCPKQEKWIFENYQTYGANISICAGATVDFLAGKVKRAPKWMSRCGLEWFYRFLKEPKRLFRRYFIDDMKIIGLIWKYRKLK